VDTIDRAIKAGRLKASRPTDHRVVIRRRWIDSYLLLMLVLVLVLALLVLPLHACGGHRAAGHHHDHHHEKMTLALSGQKGKRTRGSNGKRKR